MDAEEPLTYGNELQELLQPYRPAGWKKKKLKKKKIKRQHGAFSSSEETSSSEDGTNGTNGLNDEDVDRARWEAEQIAIFASEREVKEDVELEVLPPEWSKSTGVHGDPSLSYYYLESDPTIMQLDRPEGTIIKMIKPWQTWNPSANTHPNANTMLRPNSALPGSRTHSGTILMHDGLNKAGGQGDRPSSSKAGFERFKILPPILSGSER